MRWRTFIIGWVLAVAVLLLAHRQSPSPQPLPFRQVVDLTRAVNVSAGDPRWDNVATSMDASAPVAQVPAERLVAPLVVLDVRARVAANPDYQVSMDDVARWERANGQVPAGAVVMARTGWEHPTSRHAPGFSPDAVRFLAEGRTVFGFGIDTPSVDSGADAVTLPVRRYLQANRLYSLENVANLGRAPAAGAMVVIAPAEAQNGHRAPVRLLALVR
jgi:kynurenine formamidase